MPALSELERSFFDREGSAFTVSVMRVLAVLVTWSRFAGGMVPAFADRPVDLVIAALFWVASPLAFVGLFSRASIALTGAACLAAHGIQGHGAGVLALQSHHVFTQGLLCALLALTPCGGRLSLDALWLGAPGRGPRWGQDLLRLQLTVLYLGAVYEKSYPAWLDGSRMEHFLMQVYLGSDRPDGPWLRAVALAGAWGTWLVELGLAVAVWTPRWAWATLAIGAGFHAAVYATMPVGTFTATMFVFLLAAVDGDDLERVLLGSGEVAERSGPPWALALAPLLLLPAVRAAGVGVPAPSGRVFEGLALEACEATLSVGGREVPLPADARGGGADDVRRAAARLCRRVGRPVDARGRCATAEGWAPFAWTGVCEAEPAPPSSRRRSAL